MTSADKFLASAIEEYEEGQVDQALWARASAQSGDDESLVIAAYLRARATALRLQKRDRRRERRARTSPTQDTGYRNVEPGSRSEARPAEAVGVRFRGLQPRSKFAAAAAGAVLASVLAAAWLIASPQESESSGSPSVSAVKPSTGNPAPASPVGGTRTVAVGASGGASEGDSISGLKATVQQLKDSGNWNVFVLYAAKWTRDDPNNAAAWNELSIGYANLHQYDDALVAATKAVELSPAEAPFLRNLGHLNVTLERLPEAGSAFERALAANPDDADALCGAARVAYRLGRTTDAEAIARRIKSSDANCPGLSDGESVAVVVGRVAATKRSSSVPR